MRASYLLDTNMLSDLVRRPQGTVAHRIGEVGEDAICTSIIVAAELRYGAAKKQSRRLDHQLDLILSRLPILRLDEPVDKIYAEIRTLLERAGTPVGGNDLLIGAQALGLGLTVVTANLKEFSRIPGLDIETWL